MDMRLNMFRVEKEILYRLGKWIFQEATNVKNNLRLHIELSHSKVELNDLWLFFLKYCHLSTMGEWNS